MAVYEDTRAAVTVRVPGGEQVDIYIDLSMRVHDAIVNLIPYLRDQFAAEDRDVTMLDDRTVRWQLVRGHSTVLDSSQTLEAAGVRAGDKLSLQKTVAKETYAALIDDVPESIAQFQIERYKAWSDKATKVATGVIVPTVAFGLAVALIQYVVTRPIDLLQRGAIGGVLLALAFVGLLVAFRVNRKSPDGVTASAGGSVAACSGLIFLAAALVTAVPVHASLWHVVAASVGVFTAALLLRVSTAGLEIVTYAAMVLSGVLGVGCGVSLLLPEDSVTQSAALSCGVGVIYLLFVSSAALRVANIPAPFVPTLGESYIDPNEKTDITQLPTSSSTQAIRSIINREQQTVDAHNAIVGMTLGGVLAIVVSLGAIAGSMDIDSTGVMCVFMGVVVAAMLFRGLSYDDMLTQAVWLGGICLCGVVVPVMLAFSRSGDGVLLGVCGVVVASLVVLVFYVTRESKVTSPIVKFVFEIIEFGCYVALFVLIAMIVDVWGIIRYA